jgi:signal transduction histidine kinase
VPRQFGCDGGQAVISVSTGDRSVARAMLGAAITVSCAFFCLLNYVASSIGWADLAVLNLGLPGADIAPAIIPLLAAWRVRDKRSAGSSTAAPETTAAAADHHARLLLAVAQELRNPLTTIVGFADVLTAPAGALLSESERAGCMRFILDNGRSLSGFLARVADYARAESGSLKLIEQTVDAAEVAEAAVRLCRSEAESRDITIRAHLIDGIDLVCDARRVRQSLVDLVSLAMRHTGRAGTVGLAFAQHQAGGLAMLVTAPAATVSAADVAAFFDPDPQRDGLDAFSVPVAYRVALMHSGALTVETVPGKGMVIRFVIPAARVVWPGAKGARPVTA